MNNILLGMIKIKDNKEVSLCCTSFQNLLHFNVVCTKTTVQFEVLCII